MDVEWVILADAAEVVNNKLYVLGGGWQHLTINAPPPVPHACAIAVAFSVPWLETNQLHNIEILVEDQDGAQLSRVDAQLEVGRPAGIPLGLAQRVQMAAKLLVIFQTTGTHAVSVCVEGKEKQRLTFEVMPGRGFVPER